MLILVIVCFQHSKQMPINAYQCVTSKGYPGPLFSISLYHDQAKGHWIVGQCCLICKLVYWLGTCENFIPNSKGSLALFLSFVCPTHFLQSTVCKSAVDSLKSWRAVLLSQDWCQEGAFALTHTLFLACTSWIRLLYWLGTCMNFIPNSEGNLALFLLVVCPTLFCNQQSAGRSAVNCLKSWRAVLLLQDWWWEGTFTCTLLPSDIAIVFCIILNNMTMKDYFSMLKSSVMPQCPAGLLITVQPSKHIHWEDWTLSS
jgi:hypothetical protein